LLVILDRVFFLMITLRDDVVFVNEVSSTFATKEKSSSDQVSWRSLFSLLRLSRGAGGGGVAADGKGGDGNGSGDATTLLSEASSPDGGGFLASSAEARSVAAGAFPMPPLSRPELDSFAASPLLSAEVFDLHMTAL
jgi:hypothetical protein